MRKDTLANAPSSSDSDGSSGSDLNGVYLHLQNNATARAWEINSDHQPAAAWSATAARPERLSDVHDVCCSIFSTPARQMQREHVRFPAVCGSCFDLTCDDDQIAALVRFLKSEMT